MSAPVAKLALRRERLVADGLFWFQVLCACGFGVAQFLAMQKTVAGVSITWLGLWLAFLVVNLALALGALREHPGRVIRQTVVIYGVWTVVCAINFGWLLIAGGQWNAVDTVTAAITATGVAGAIVVGRLHGVGVHDPYVRAAFAVLCKAVPQLTLAWNMARDGGGGVAAYAILTGHLTIGLRLWQVWYSIREAGWDRHRIGIGIGEAANEASWIVATVVWLWVD
ncbi:hypothetical protein KDL45_05310 [bacterium]|nr:hypothetical protein [bacterium]MCB1749570.1 hypothetical protein [Gammaproteobacteria bacterium]